MAKGGAGDEGSIPVMKWIGIATAVLSFGSAVYGAVRAEAELRERRRTVSEELATGHSQQSVGDYSAAWESMQRAATAAAVDGVFAKLLGGLSEEQTAVLTAQQDLAMQWVREAHAPQGHTFSEIVDKVGGVLATGANGATGERKADLLAHQGWSYFLKQRDGDSSVRPEALYQQAISLDAKNPYANAFWGDQIVFNHGPLDQAREHFTAALASSRAHDTVRYFQLAGFAGSQSDAADLEWWRVVAEMRKNGESLAPETLSKMTDDYYRALNDNDYYKQLTAAVTPLEHLDLLKALLDSRDLNESRKVTALAARATILEDSGRKEEALTAWREVETFTHANPNYTIAPRVEIAIKRLSVRARQTSAR